MWLYYKYCSYSNLSDNIIYEYSRDAQQTQNEVPSAQHQRQRNILSEVVEEVTTAKQMFLNRKREVNKEEVTQCSQQIGTSGTENETDDQLLLLDDCKMLHTCLFETLRIAAHPLGAVRKVMEPEGWTVYVDEDAGGSEGDKTRRKSYVIPCGSYVAASHIVQNTHISQEDLAFNPLLSNVVEESKDDYKFTSFSHGVHRCPGQRVAVMVL